MLIVADPDSAYGRIDPRMAANEELGEAQGARCPEGFVPAYGCGEEFRNRINHIGIAYDVVSFNDLAHIDSYLAFMKRQLTELLTNYGDILCIWFDGEWDHKDPKTKELNMDWKYDEIYSLIHSIQPRCLVLNNHHHALRDGEDIYGVEREKKDGKEQKFTLEPECSSELCDTMANGSFGYKVTDTEWKTTEEIRAMLKRTNDRGISKRV